MKFSRVCNSKLLSIMISNQKTPKLRIYGWSSDLQIPCNCPGVDCWSALFQWGPGRGFDGAWTATRGRAFSWETVICSIRLSATEVSASTSVTSYRIRTALCKTSQIKISYTKQEFSSWENAHSSESDMTGCGMSYLCYCDSVFLSRRFNKSTNWDRFKFQEKITFFGKTEILWCSSADSRINAKFSFLPLRQGVE